MLQSALVVIGLAMTTAAVFLLRDLQPTGAWCFGLGALLIISGVGWGIARVVMTDAPHR